MFVAPIVKSGCHPGPATINAWAVLVLCATLLNCGERRDAGTGSPTAQKEPASAAEEDRSSAMLCASRLAAARKSLEAGDSDEALLWAVAALRADPHAAEAQDFAAELLRKTTWLFPEYRIPHPSPVGLLRFQEPSSLWVALEGASNTLVRWDLRKGTVEAVLFPTRDGPVHHAAADPPHRRLVVTRGGRRLLCDALTLKPIATLGDAPATLPPSLTTFSDDGLLVASASPSEDGSWSWSLHDTATGELLRQTEAQGSAAAEPLCSSLDRKHLRVLHADGTLLTVPVSPILPTRSARVETPQRIRQAFFPKPGRGPVVVVEAGPGQPPELRSLTPEDGGEKLPPIAEILSHEGWSRHPCLWQGPIREIKGAPEVSGKRVFFTGGALAPVRGRSEIGALAASKDRILTGEQNGFVTVYQRLSPPEVKNADLKSPRKPAPVEQLERLAAFLTGLRFVDHSGTMETLDAARRITLLTDGMQAADHDVFPDIQFETWRDIAQTLQPREIPKDALAPLLQRIARSETVTPSEQRTRDFREGKHGEVAAWIEAAGPSGPAAASNLKLALLTEHPEWIEACLRRAEDLPPSLRKLALSRIAWLRGNIAAAMEIWDGEVPTETSLRAAEDWVGWEQADFSEAFAKLRDNMLAERRKTTLPAQPNPEDLKRVLAKLEDPDTIQRIGRSRFAADCLAAASAMAESAEFAPDAAELASLARQTGGNPAECLRVEATALTTAGDYLKAREQWVRLISETPQASHQPDDYAEAAYTAFESADNRQAMHILETGMHRFPDHSSFAHRAGWISLLAGYPDASLRFLSEGRRSGFTKETTEHATALMAVAAAKSGQEIQASAMAAELVHHDPAWGTPDAVEALDWPDDLRETLRRLLQETSGPGTIRRGP